MSASRSEPDGAQTGSICGKTRANGRNMAVSGASIREEATRVYWVRIEAAYGHGVRQEQLPWQSTLAAGIAAERGR